jgi:hypothetical protein
MGRQSREGLREWSGHLFSDVVHGSVAAGGLRQPNSKVEVSLFNQ